MRTPVAAALLTLTLAAPAHAYEYEGQHPATGRTAALIRMAGDYWTAKHVPACPLTAWQAPDLTGSDGDAWGRGDGTTCEMWLSDDLVATVDVAEFDSDSALEACTTVTHELGHARGLPHSDRGVMAGAGSPPPPRSLDNVPWFCVRWAERAFKRGLLSQDISRDGVADGVRELRQWVRRNRS